MSSTEVKRAARVVFEKFKSIQDLQQRESGPNLLSPRSFVQINHDVAQEAFHILELRNLLMRALDQESLYQLTSLGNSTNVDDIFEKTVDRAFISKISEILDGELNRACLDKSYEDAITSAFRILEVRVRTRINAGADRIGTDLMDDAFHPERGKLVFGETASERQAVHQVFRSAYMMLRNPPSHRYLQEFAGAEIVEIVMFVDFLLKILRKATDRAPN
ncbi:MAG: TIGR02391 family protein [Candidatus Bathyarchaeia archaeon]